MRTTVSLKTAPLIGGSIPYSASLPIRQVTNLQNQIISAQLVVSLIGSIERIFSYRASGFALQPIFGSVDLSGCGVITMLLLRCQLARMPADEAFTWGSIQKKGKGKS